MSHSKKMILITIASLGLSSCSSIEKSMIYSGIAGAVIGGFVGRYASPDRESDKINIAILTAQTVLPDSRLVVSTLVFAELQMEKLKLFI